MRIGHLAGGGMEKRPPIAHGRHRAQNAGLGMPFEREHSAMPIGAGSHADRHCKSRHRLAVFYPHLDGAHDDNG